VSLRTAPALYLRRLLVTVFLLIVLAFLVGMVCSFLVMKEQVAITKKRLRTATDLLNARETADELGDGTDVVNGWTIERYTAKCIYTAGDYAGRKFDGVMFRLRNDSETVEIPPSPQMPALHPGDANFVNEFKAYRGRVVEAAKSL
jgi:hypothetical protein